MDVVFFNIIISGQGIRFTFPIEMRISNTVGVWEKNGNATPGGSAIWEKLGVLIKDV
jgi:hypothetical protein